MTFSPCCGRVEGLEAKLAEAQADIRRLTAEGVAFSAEVERLREALLLKMDEYKAHDPGWCAACDSARAALRGGGGHFKWENGSAVPCKCRGGE